MELHSPLSENEVQSDILIGGWNSQDFASKLASVMFWSQFPLRCLRMMLLWMMVDLLSSRCLDWHPDDRSRQLWPTTPCRVYVSLQISKMIDFIFGHPKRPGSGNRSVNLRVLNSWCLDLEFKLLCLDNLSCAQYCVQCTIWLLCRKLRRSWSCHWPWHVSWMSASLPHWRFCSNNWFWSKRKG